MNKTVFTFLILSLLLISCSTQPEAVPTANQEERPLTSERDGVFTEWYPGHQQIKRKGRLDGEGQREGVWKQFSEEGVVLSITVYTRGKKDGHIIVRYPNNIVHYDGEYLMDERVGLWRFYDEEGNLVTQEDYGYPEE